MVGEFDALQIPATSKLWGLNFAVLTPALLDTAHRHGIRVDIWTVDNPERMRQLIDRGVDGIVTNRVDLLGEVLA